MSRMNRMGTAAQIRNYRVRSGKSASELARQLGLNEAWYADLERRDDEFASTLTLFQAIELASALGVRLNDLVGNQPLPDENIPLTDLPLRIQEHVARKGISLVQFEEKMGWDLADLMKSPIQAVADLPLVFLQSLAAALAINWLCLIPQGD